MKNVRKRWATLVASSFLVVGTGVAAITPTASAAPAPQRANACGAPVRHGHIAGVIPAVSKTKCASGSKQPSTAAGRAPKTSNPAKGTPPLLYHGGPMMMTASTGPLVVTPIYWSPSAHTISSSYSSPITQYFTDVAAASGQTSNVFSVANEYNGTNGQISYSTKLGAPITDTSALPASGCTLTARDKTGIYSDGTGYSACLDDAQIQTEINKITSANGLPRNLSHIYVLYLPKGVESCFNPGGTTTSANQCTINHEPSATYCAYHSYASSTVYANMPYPVYQSGTGYTCGSDGSLGGVQAPNGNAAADTEISPSSHEVNEAITDPDTQTGWYDSSGYENGDECAYVYGGTQGTSGALYNQVINGHHYLTQEEFSNQDFGKTRAGCVPSSSAES